MLRKTQETLDISRVSRAFLRSQEATSMRSTARNLVAVFMAVSLSSVAVAQPEMIRCLPPEVPMTDIPEAVLTEYRTEIAAEFEAYFAAVSKHIACLDIERSRALAEAHAATEAYSDFLNTPLAQKDLP
mgnify:CR=1 FL=1